MGEVKSNLIKSEREDLLRRFKAPHFKRIALVVMGEPTSEYKSSVHAAFLEEKREKIEHEWKLKQQEKERKRLIATRQKELVAQRKAALEAAKKEEEEKKALEGEGPGPEAAGGE